MSICSDVYITKEEAVKRVKQTLLYQQEQLIESAIKGMSLFEMSHILNRDSDLYYYNIEGEFEELGEDE